MHRQKLGKWRNHNEADETDEIIFATKIEVMFDMKYASVIQGEK